MKYKPIQDPLMDGRCSRFVGESNAVLQYIHETPGCTDRDIAESGLYKPVSASNPEKAAKHWARRQTNRLLTLNLISFVAGDGTRNKPYKYCCTGEEKEYENHERNRRLALFDRVPQLDRSP